MNFSVKIKIVQSRKKRVFAGKGGHIPLFPDPIPPLPNLLLDRGVKRIFSSVTGRKKFLCPVTTGHKNKRQVKKTIK
jgi:hypothetical protein